MATSKIDFKMTVRLEMDGREVNAWPLVVRPGDVLVLHAAPGMRLDELVRMQEILTDINKSIELASLIVSGDKVQRIAVVRAACDEPEPAESDCDLAGTPHIRCRPSDTIEPPAVPAPETLECPPGCTGNYPICPLA